MMEYKGYLAEIEFDDEANIFYGSVTNIRDVITFQGETVNELRQAFSDSVEDYLEFCAERGEAPNKPRQRGEYSRIKLNFLLNE